MKRKEFFTTLGALTLAPLAGKAQDNPFDLTGMDCEVYYEKKQSITGKITRIIGGNITIELEHGTTVFRHLGKVCRVVATDDTKIVEFKLVVKEYSSGVLKGDWYGVEIYYKY